MGKITYRPVLQTQMLLRESITPSQARVKSMARHIVQMIGPFMMEVVSIKYLMRNIFYPLMEGLERLLRVLIRSNAQVFMTTSGKMS